LNDLKLSPGLHSVAKTVICVSIGICLYWGISLDLDALAYARQERIAFRIILGDTFQTDFVSSLALKAPRGNDVGGCNPSLVRSTAIIDLNLAEESYALADRLAIDWRMGQVENSTRAALECAPSDAFLWCVRYWVEVVKYGFKDEFLTDLKMSYNLGPHEAWIAEKRNSLALAVFDRLGPKLQDMVVAEYAGMLDAGLIQQAFDNLVGPGFSIQNRLLGALGNVRLIHREWLAKGLREAGYRIDVPGVELTEERPWR
jgi:hypothetical protein